MVQKRLFGGLVIAGAKSGYEGSPVLEVYQFLEKIESTATGTAADVTMKGGKVLHLPYGGFTEMAISENGGITLGQFTRELIEGTGGLCDSSGKPLFLLGGESLETLAEKFEQLRDFEGKRDQFRNLFLLGGVGSAVFTALHAKAGEKVKVSAPVG